MNPIQTNKPVFFGNGGDVLKSGRIYIGQPNQYPISFPKTVTFQDSTGAQFQAQQPLKTNDQGQISYNGKAIIALVDGNYSLLVQDRNGVQISDGYTPFVSNPGEAEINLGSVTQVGLLLSDIKLLDVTPGDTVRNVGKITATDGLGADWLVVSNTGNPADDVDLIDFANGTQGQRIENVIYSGVNDIASVIQSGVFNPEAATEIFSGTSTSVSLAGLPENGPGLYVVRTSEDFFIYVSDASVDAFGAVAVGNPSVNLLFWTNVKYISGNFTVISYTYDAGTVTNSAATITKIFKV